MLDNKAIYNLLLEKSEKIEKQRLKLTTAIFIIPIIYYLLSSGVKISFKLPLLDVKDLNLIFILTPAIYSILILYSQILHFRNEKINSKLDELESTVDKDLIIILNNLIHPTNWRNLLTPISAPIEILNTIKKGGALGFSGIALILIPAAIVTIILPVFFFIYTIIVNFKHEGDFYLIAVLSNAFAIWTYLGLVIYSFSNNSKKKNLIKK